MDEVIRCFSSDDPATCKQLVSSVMMMIIDDDDDDHR
jgi:hypothetical protein